MTVPAGTAYHEVHRLGRPGFWRPIVGVVALAVLGIGMLPIVVMSAFVAGVAAYGGDPQAAYDRIRDLDDVTPLGLAYVNLTLAGLIPVAFFVSWLVHGLRPGWLSSIAPRIRWRYLVTCLGLAVLALVATIIVSVLLPTGTAEDVGAQANSFDAEAQRFALVILVLTPLQAAGEEYAFRGYLTQAFGGLVSRLDPRAGLYAAVLGPALLFALAHGVQDVPVFFDRFAFGVVAGVLVVRTGGLEAGIAMHVLNNFLAFGFALAFGDMGETLTVSEGTWWSVPVTLTQSLVYLWLALAAARRMGLSRTVEGPVLAAPEGRV